MQKRWRYTDFDSQTWAACGALFLVVAVGGVWIITSRPDKVLGALVLVLAAPIAIQSFIWAGRVRSGR